MATLAAPFILCPLADSKELIGFSPDRKENTAIVTLGRNIAIRYLVSEQKQETSWTCSRHWFTSKVVYCPELEKYAAVVDENAVWLWEETDTNLSNAKKYKFKQQVFEVLPTATLGTLIVFKNGIVSPLSEAGKPDNRRHVEGNGIVNLEESQLLSAVVHEDKNLVLLVAGEKSANRRKCRYGYEKEPRLTVYVWKISGAGGSCQNFSEVTVKMEGNEKIVGWTAISNEDESFLLYLDSTGDLQRKSIVKFTSESKDQSTEPEPVTKKGAFQKYVSIENPVVLEPYDSTTIICYGSDSAEEGAIVFVYDIQFDLILSRQSLKLYSFPPIMARTENFIFIPLGLNILVVGIRVGKSLLSSVAGKHQIQSVDFFESRDPWKTGWEVQSSVPRKEKDVHVEQLNETVYDAIDLTDLEAIVDTLEKNGYPESSICAQVIPPALENATRLSDDTALKWILEYFEEIPEKFLVDLVVSLVASSLRTSSDAMETETIQSTELRNEIIQNVISRSCDNALLVKNLKSVDYASAKVLLQLLTKTLQETPLIPGPESSPEGSAKLLAKAMKWIGAVLDAQYSNFVFNSETDLVEKLIKILNDRIQLMKEIEALGPLVEIIRTKTKYDARPNRNAIYRVESVLFT